MRYRTLIVAAMWAVFAGTAAADVNPGQAPVAQGSFAATCAKVTCRTVTRDLQLRAPNGGTIHVMTTASPYVDEDGVVALYAGEAIEISFDRNALTHPKFVRTIDRVDLEGLKGYQADAPPPDPATPAILSLELRQTEGKPDMTLVLRNETGVPLKYDLTMFVPTPEGIKSAHTSACPVLPGMMGNEFWPHPVVMLLMSNFRKADTGQFNCD